jgi:nucleoside-diphosphate-sugar epimerase
MRVFVTGATGFIGQHLLTTLQQAGFDVRVLTRRDPPATWNGTPFETVRGDLADEGVLARLVCGADVVIHAAGLTKACSPEEFLRVNRDGTAALARRAASTRAARFILVSSLAAREPTCSPYAHSKREGERAGLAAFAERPEALTILRPPAVYGPGDAATLPLFRATLRPVAPVPHRCRAAIIHVQDVARAIATLARGAPSGCHALADPRPEGYEPRELLTAAARATGGRPYLLPAPSSLLLLAGRICDLWAKISREPQIFGLGKAREMLFPDWSIRPGELLPASLFSPHFGIEEGFADTVAWYRKAGWL